MVAAPSDRRFRRAHVKPARRRRGWRHFVPRLLQYLAVVALMGYVAYRGSMAAAHASALQVNRIVVRGNERLSRDEVLSLLKGLRGENLVWTDLDRWRDRLLASPWVRAAALRRSIPSTVEVVVSERQPAFIGRLDGEVYLMDEHGIVMDRYGPQYADFDLPVVDGLASSGSGGRAVDEGRAEVAARAVASLRGRPEIARRLSQLDVADPHNVSVILSGDSASVELGDDQFLTRLESYLELAPTLRERVPNIDAVDLRFDERIYVRQAQALRSAAASGRGRRR
jgi:cell division protein FtsQ